MTGSFTIEQLKADLASGKQELGDDEYIGADGLPYCKHCGQPCYVVLDGDYCMRALCRCKREQLDGSADRRKQLMFEERQEACGISAKYKNAFFATSTITAENRPAYNIAKAYVIYHDEVLQGNIGLYIWGDSSSGKTHFAAAICNELLKKGEYCMFTTMSDIIGGMKDNAKDVLQSIKSAHYLFIDDLGKEFYGRFMKSDGERWVERLIYRAINERYNAALPTVFTSNMSLSELASKYALDRAIVERINEMSTRVIKLNGANYRQKYIRAREQLAKELGI